MFNQPNRIAEAKGVDNSVNYERSAFNQLKESDPLVMGLNASIIEHHAQEDAWKRQNFSNDEFNRLRTENLNRIMDAHQLRILDQAAQLEASINDAGEKWEKERYKNPSDKLLRQQEVTARIQGASDEELTEHINHYQQFISPNYDGELPTNIDPYEMDLTAAEMKRRGMKKEYGIFKSLMNNISYRQPWKNAPEIKQKITELEKLQGIKTGDISAMEKIILKLKR